MVKYGEEEKLGICGFAEKAGEQIRERGPFQSCKFSPAALRQALVSQGAQGIFTTHLTKTRCHELHMSC